MEQVVGLVTLLQAPLNLNFDDKQRLVDFLQMNGYNSPNIFDDKHNISGGYVLEDKTVSFPVKNTNDVLTYVKPIKYHELHSHMKNTLGMDDVSVQVCKVAYIR